jgi:glycosyltransferase involved in cell wall biosynthesis
MNPRVSICVPNLNTRPFLDERFRTILEQSFGDWELLVYDSHSDDGSWEFISPLARREPRMRAWQGPREGTPGSWTPCVRAARGDYVYIATSDDTMAPDCLEKLVAALDAHPECDLAHCTLRAIDARGEPAHDASDWWWRRSIFATSSGPLLHRRHVRRAPFDGLLHLGGENVYTSITQLLIRRSLFSRVGLFDSSWGSVGDFAWGMRAGLVASTVHVPDTWGGWRVHSAQATAGAGLGSSEHAQRIEQMIADSIEASAARLSRALGHRLQSEWARRTKEARTFEREFGLCDTAVRRRVLIGRRLLTGSVGARQHAKSKLAGAIPWPDVLPQWVQSWIEGAGLGPALVPAAPDVHKTKAC